MWHFRLLYSRRRPDLEYRMLEFEWYYYLDFVRNRKKIAYAPSMGPNGRKTIPAHLAERVRREVKTYQAVAVKTVERRLSLIQICPWFSTRLCCLM